MTRGILVDPAGYFVGAYEWPDNEPAPNFNMVLGGQRPTAPLSRLVLLVSDAALAVENTSGRWRFREEVWEYPTERRWTVRQRRDFPNLWFLTGSKLIWPERPPNMPDGSKLVDVEPPVTKRSRKPIWKDDTGEWIVPRRVAALGADGTVLNAVASYIDEDLPPGAAGSVELSADLTGQDETGQDVVPSLGDKIDTSGETPAVEIRRIPRYKQVKVETLEAVLANNNLTAAFAAFVQSKGFDIGKVRQIKTISLRNKLLREFVAEQGYTMAQAYNQLQATAEQLERQEREEQNTIGAEE